MEYNWITDDSSPWVQAKAISFCYCWWGGFSTDRWGKKSVVNQWWGQLKSHFIVCFPLVVQSVITLFIFSSFYASVCHHFKVSCCFLLLLMNHRLIKMLHGTLLLQKWPNCWYRALWVHFFFFTSSIHLLLFSLSSSILWTFFIG